MKPAKTYAVYISPFPQEQLFQMVRESLELEKPYHEAVRVWEQENPYPKYSDDKEGDSGIKDRDARRERQGEYLRGLDSNILNAFKQSRAIGQQIDYERDEIYFGLGWRFWDMMEKLYSTSLLCLLTANYVLGESTMDAHALQDKDIRKNFSDFKGRLDATHEDFKGSCPILSRRNNLEALAQLFTDTCSAPLYQKHQLSPKFHSTRMLTGRFGGGYLFTTSDFFNAFSHAIDPEENIRGVYKSLEFSLCGMLEGDYYLTGRSHLEPVQFPTKSNYGLLALLAPVEFKVTISESFDSIVNPVFEKIREYYADCIVARDTLNIWKPEGYRE